MTRPVQEETGCMMHLYIYIDHRFIFRVDFLTSAIQTWMVGAFRQEESLESGSSSRAFKLSV